jgi:hypothetical protein
MLDEPGQVSAPCELDAAAQIVPAAANPSAGQVALVPEQVSAASQAPTAARQTAPALPTGCWQLTLEPSHWSFVQAFPSSVQAVPLGFFASAGQLVEVPLHVSAASHSPAAARQLVPLPTGEQIPTFPGRLQAPHPPLQAVSQQTPFAQNPEAHWLPELQESPKDGS